MPRNIPPPYKESGDSGQLMLSHHVQVCREVTLGRAGNVATLTHPEIFDVESVTLACLLSVLSQIDLELCFVPRKLCPSGPAFAFKATTKVLKTIQ